jgi:hypothetical protein
MRRSGQIWLLVWKHVIDRVVLVRALFPLNMGTLSPTFKPQMELDGPGYGWPVLGGMKELA